MEQKKENGGEYSSPLMLLPFDILKGDARTNNGANRPPE